MVGPFWTDTNLHLGIDLKDSFRCITMRCMILYPTLWSLLCSLQVAPFNAQMFAEFLQKQNKTIPDDSSDNPHADGCSAEPTRRRMRRRIGRVSQETGLGVASSYGSGASKIVGASDGECHR